MNTTKSFPFDVILEWYQKNGRHELPWREYDYDQQTLLYRVWAAEIMLQQTQASRVVDYFTRLIEKYPSVGSLAQATWEDFFPYYEGLGYYRRGRNMLALAREVVQNYEGQFPGDIASLKALPGIGPYTAAAIVAFALDEPVLSFDTNLNKIFTRYLYGSKYKKLSTNEMHDLIESLQNSGISGRDINNAMMDFGSIVSLNNPEKVDWENYPLRGCAFFLDHGIRERKDAPIRISKKQTKKDTLSIEVHLHKDHKVYYSDNLDTYEPFDLPKSGGDHRHYIQDWFFKKYDLVLSVRPAFYRDNSVIKYHAQVQSGKIDALGNYPPESIEK